jgi:hypothetical protein
MLLPFDLSWDRETGRFTFAWKGHVLSAIGGILLGAGVGALSVPWWYPLVAVALKYVGVSDEPAINWLLGLTFCAVGLGCYALKFFVVDPAAQRIARDKALVQRRPLSPDTTRVFFDGLTTDDSYDSSQDTAFHSEYELYYNAEDRLLDKRSAGAFMTFRSTALALHAFLAQHSAWWPPNQSGWPDHRYCLAPHLNIDRGSHGDLQGMREYDALQKRLDDHVRAVREAYDVLLTTLKKNGVL